MLRLLATAIAVVLLTAQAPIPTTPPPASEPYSQQNAVHEQEADHAKAEPPKSQAPSLAGANKSAPLYVHADCEHGCGYAEHEGWWDRFKTDPNALFALAVALFTLGLVATSAWTNLLTLSSVRLSREEFNATHRPQIVIHSVKFDPVVSDIGDFDLDKAAATVTFYNTGPSPALIEGIRYSIAQRRLPLASGIFPVTEIAPRHPEIASGMGDYVELGSDIQIRMARLASDKGSAVVLIGKIFYRDRAGGLRQTGFCRMLVISPQGASWVRLTLTDDTEYEYGY